MLNLLLAMFLLVPGGGSVGASRMVIRDPQGGPTPVTDKYLLPERVPDCTTPEQIQRANDERIKGWEPECILPRKSDLKPPQ